MTDHQHTALPSGISKHLHSSTPDAIMSENLYSTDTSSKNKDETYQTMEGRTVPSHTGQKINPFNVKGVPGCKSCGGSGWKESARHPHPCNECAKKTVPNIDTYLTKVGQTATPVREDVILEKTIPVTEYVEQQKIVPITNQVEVTKNVPVTTNVPVVENIPVKKEVLVTREIERTRDIPVTREIPFTENVHVHEKVPKTSYEYITSEEPVTRTIQETTTVPITTNVPYIEEREYTREVPITQHRTVIDEVPVREQIPIREMTEVTRTHPTTSYVDVTKEVPNQTTIRHHGYEVLEGHRAELLEGNTINRNITQEIPAQTMTTSEGYKIIQTTNYPTTTFKGLPDCKDCRGDGMRKSKLTGRLKPCKNCVKATGNCPLCGNTGWRNDKDRKCDCIYAK